MYQKGVSQTSQVFALIGFNRVQTLQFFPYSPSL